MARWSGIRNKLENEYLAESLRGRIRYFVTAYRESHDGDKGRAAILLDGKHILEGNTFERVFHPCEWWPYDGVPPIMSQQSLDFGQIDQWAFYKSFDEFDNQSIEKSLVSENLLVRIFAVLDRRVGKRRLLAMKDTIEEEPEWFKMFYYIRAEAEGILKEVHKHGSSHFTIH